MSFLRAGAGAYAATATRSGRKNHEPVASVIPLELIVRSTRIEADGVLSIDLGARNGRDLPSWFPGAHIDLIMPSGTIRQYSLCGPASDRTFYRIAVRRLDHGSGGSIEAHTLRTGSLVSVQGPRNAFPFVHFRNALPGAPRVVFIAAGIGITALLPMIESAVNAGADWHLTYIGRGRTAMAFLDRLAAFDPGGHRVRIHTGPRQSPARILEQVRAQSSVYFCGPAELLSAVRPLLDMDPTVGLHYERFGPPPVIGGTPFSVRLANGDVIEVDAASSTLDAVREARPDAPYSCRQGFCGTCRVRVLDGDVERRGRSRFLDEQDTMLICVDRARGTEVTLDL